MTGRSVANRPGRSAWMIACPKSFRGIEASRRLGTFLEGKPASSSTTRHTRKTGEKKNLKPNPLAEHCSQCGSSNVSLVERPLSLWDVLAMVPRSLSFLSPAFFSLLVRANPRQRRQDRQYRCLRCHSTWHI